MDFADIYALCQALHNSPERSGEEKQTRKMLMEFLASHTALELDSSAKAFMPPIGSGRGPLPAPLEGLLCPFRDSPPTPLTLGTASLPPRRRCGLRFERSWTRTWNFFSEKSSGIPLHWLRNTA